MNYNSQSGNKKWWVLAAIFQALVIASFIIILSNAWGSKDYLSQHWNRIFNYDQQKQEQQQQQQQCDVNKTTSVSLENNGDEWVCQESGSGCTLLNSSSNPNSVFSEQWVLPSMDSGSFSFSVCDNSAKGKGLIIYLVNNPVLSGDATKGYTIVLDDEGKSYIGSNVTMISRPADSKKMNESFTLEKENEECEEYVVHYHQNNVLVFSGEKLIMCHKRDADLDSEISGVKYFGFGTMRKEETGIVVKDIKTYDAVLGDTCPTTLAKTLSLSTECAY